MVMLATMTKVDSICQRCGTLFWQKPSDRDRGRVFCSRRCSYDARTKPIEERFWSKVQKTESCWLWTATRNGEGGVWHGILFSHKENGQTRFITAHRLSWQIHFGSIPEGCNVLHRCDVPHCVNPAHLFLGTLSDNTKDMVAKDRHGEQMRRRTTCRRGHELTPDNVSVKSDGKRRCLTCVRGRDARYYRQKRARSSAVNVVGALPPSK